MHLNCLIIDDEPLARKRLSSLILKTPELNNLGECSTGKDAIVKINELRPHLIFLDIEMKDLNGFEVLKNIHHNPLVIFVTAYDNYAIEAFEYFAFDYLLKPFKTKRFNTSVNRALQHFKEKNNPQKDQSFEKLLNYLNNTKGYPEPSSILKQKLTIKSGSNVLFIEINTIKYILASGNYINIYTSDNKYLTRQSLANILSVKNDPALMRIHRSTVINIDYIDKLIYSNYGEIDVRMKDNKVFRVSKGYKKEFKKLLSL